MPIHNAQRILGALKQFNGALSELNFDGSEFDITTDVYIQGSGNNLFLDGTAVDGTSTKFKIEIVGGALRVVPT